MMDRTIAVAERLFDDGAGLLGRSALVADVPDGEFRRGGKVDERGTLVVVRQSPSCDHLGFHVFAILSSVVCVRK